MPYVVVKRCPGGPNPDLVPGMRLGDRVRRTLVDGGFVKWFPEDGLHLAPPEPEESTPELAPLGPGADLAKDHIPPRQPKPVPPAVGEGPSFDELVESGEDPKYASILIMRRTALKHLVEDVEMPQLEAEALVRQMDLDELEKLLADIADTAEIKLEVEPIDDEKTPVPTEAPDDDSGVAQTAAHLAHTHEDAGSSPAPAPIPTDSDAAPSSDDAVTTSDESEAAAPPEPPPTTHKKTSTRKKKAKGRRSKRG